MESFDKYRQEPLVSRPLLVILVCLMAPLGLEREPRAGALQILQPNEQQQQQQQQLEQDATGQGQANPDAHIQASSLHVDTKLWLRSTEFGERSNWLGARKPCTLMERILIGGHQDEPMVVSLGNSFGELEARVGLIGLSSNGVLLLEADQEDPTKPDPRKSDDKQEEDLASYLREQGDCVDARAQAHGETGAPDHDYFQFKPPAHQLSWFNPDNWHASIYEQEHGDIAEWLPQSHLVPCTEDVVVFADRSVALSTLLGAYEPASTLSFKVNFRPFQEDPDDDLSSQTVAQVNLSSSPPSPASIANVQISKLVIGHESLSQKQLDQLALMYGDSLFELNSPQSLLDNRNYANGNTLQPPMIIDESSIQTESGSELCLEEAGCLCGNERREVMAAICSFEEPLVYPRDYACEDPVRAAGYCDKICASVVSIHMDPDKFSERLVVNYLRKLWLDDSDDPDHISNYLFTGVRRIDYNKYEITIRILANSKEHYQRALGKDQELARLIKVGLERRKLLLATNCSALTSAITHKIFPRFLAVNLAMSIPTAAIKSLYGIKSVRINSSVRWRIDNYNSIFLLCLACAIGASILIAIKEDEILEALQSLSVIELFARLRIHRDQSVAPWLESARIPDESILLVAPEALPDFNDSAQVILKTPEDGQITVAKARTDNLEAPEPLFTLAI